MDMNTSTHLVIQHRVHHALQKSKCTDEVEMATMNAICSELKMASLLVESQLLIITRYGGNAGLGQSNCGNFVTRIIKQCLKDIPSLPGSPGKPLQDDVSVARFAMRLFSKNDKIKTKELWEDVMETAKAFSR